MSRQKLLTAAKVLLIAGCLALAITSCGGKKHAAAKASVSANISALATSSAGTAAKAIVQKCEQEHPLTSLSSFKAVEKCAVPAGHRVQAEACIAAGITKISAPLTTGRLATEELVLSCLEKNQ